MFDVNGWMWIMLACIIILATLLRRKTLAKKELRKQITRKYYEVLQGYKKAIFSALYSKLKGMPFEKSEYLENGLWSGIAQEPSDEIRNNYHRSLGGVFETSTAQPNKYKDHVGRLLAIWGEQKHLTDTLRNNKQSALEKKC